MSMTEDNIARAEMAWRGRLHRGLRAGHVHSGLPRNLGDLTISSHNPGCGRVSKPDPDSVPLAGSRQGTRGNRRAKETKRRGTDVQESERAIVPTKAGNRDAGTRWREGLAVLRNCCEER